MPEFSCQTYWHELPQRIPPWKDDDERRAVIAISKQIPHVITPNRTRYFAPSARRHFLAQAKRSLKDPTRLIRGIISDPQMTMFGALNILVEDLGVSPVTIEEATAAVEKVNTKVNESTQKSQGQTEHLFVESPLLQVLRDLLEAWELTVTRVERRDLNAQGRRIHAADLQPNKLALLVVDRENPLLAIAVAEQHNPRLRDKRQYLHLLVPLKFPQPWWRRARMVARIDPNLCVCAFVHHKDARGASSAREASGTAATSEAEESDVEKATVVSAEHSKATPSVISSAGKRRAAGKAYRETPSRSLTSGLRSVEVVSTAPSSQPVSDVEEDSDDQMPRKLRRLEELRAVKFRNFSFDPLKGGEDPLARVVSTTVQKFRTRKGVVHHWSQRLIERHRRNVLYGYQLPEEED